MRHLFLIVVAFSLACLVLLSTGVAATGSGGWSHLGHAPKHGKLVGLNGAVYALNADKAGVLFVGGNFTSAGGDAKIAHIATWDGLNWGAVGSPTLNGDVHAIAYHDGKVYVGGVFTDAGGNANADFLAVWDGTTWKPFCNSQNGQPAFGGSVAALQIIGSTLYVGGSFGNGAGIASADYLVACDLNTGAASSLVLKDGDINGGVYGLAADSNGTLYAAGQFINMAGNVAGDHVAAYSGGAWHAMGGVDSYVRSITAHGTDVYIGSDSLNIGGIAQADHVARWNGSAWSAMGSSTDKTNGWFPGSTFIYAMTTSGSKVFVAGSFQNANGDPTADHIAEWDGSAWHAIGSNGAGNGAWIGNGLALAPFHQLLYAGGNFTTAGTDTQASSIASYPLVADTTAPQFYAYSLYPHMFTQLKTRTVCSRTSPLSLCPTITFGTWETSEVVFAHFTVQVEKNGAWVNRVPRVDVDSEPGWTNAGTQEFRFTGRINGKSLPPGNYRLEMSAVDETGNKSGSLYREFTIKPRT